MSVPLIVELMRFCEESQSVAAEFSPTQLPRLLDSVADTTGGVSMQVRGFLDARGRPNLDLRIGGELQVLCQRCLRPMAVRLDVGQTLAFGDEDLDAVLDPEGVELLPRVSHLDLAELVEDEVLLSLPMLPRHEVCELPASADSGPQSAFAALQGRLGQVPKHGDQSAGNAGTTGNAARGVKTAQATRGQPHGPEESDHGGSRRSEHED